MKSVSDEVEHWSLTVLHSKFIECDAKVIPVDTNERLKCSFEMFRGTFSPVSPLLFNMVWRLQIL